MLLLLSRQVRKNKDDMRIADVNWGDLPEPTHIRFPVLDLLRFCFRSAKNRLKKNKKKQRPTVDWFSPDCDSDRESRLGSSVAMQRLSRPSAAACER